MWVLDNMKRPSSVGGHHTLFVFYISKCRSGLFCFPGSEGIEIQFHSKVPILSQGNVIRALHGTAGFQDREACRLLFSIDGALDFHGGKAVLVRIVACFYPLNVVDFPPPVAPDFEPFGKLVDDPTFSSGQTSLSVFAYILFTNHTEVC